MNILEYEGSLASRVRCVKGCGYGKMLDIVETRGEPSDEIIARLNGVAEHHEHYHPSHEIEVIIYRNRVDLSSWDIEDDFNPLLLGC